MNKKLLSDIRREYGDRELDETTVPDDPFELFQHWFDEAIASDSKDPSAMVVATVDEFGMPDTRVILLKNIVDGCFIFYTHYESAKGMQLAKNPQIALNFYWPNLSRQVRVRGYAEKVSREESLNYFSSRPRGSQMSASISPQSRVIPNRDYLTEQVAVTKLRYEDQSIPCPDSWGGYAVKPVEMEFWQGRDNRLHDRFRYRLENHNWRRERLAP